MSAKILGKIPEERGATLLEKPGEFHVWSAERKQWIEDCGRNTRWRTQFQTAELSTAA